MPPIFNFRKKIENKPKKDFYIYKPSYIKEDFKGTVNKEQEIKLPDDIGEEHPFDFSVAEGIYKKFGLVTGVIDKFVDFIVGPGFYIKTKNKRAKKIIEDFMQDNNFDTLLRGWIKESLIKGNGFMELAGKKNEPPKCKILNANWIYVKRDEKGNILGYNQYRGGIEKNRKIIPFEPYEIAHITHNRIGDMAYGLGIIYPAMNTINNLLKNEKDLHVLMGRKANTPIVVKLGTPEEPPTDDDVTAFGKKLEWLNNKHEWVTGPNVEFSTLNFGDFGQKFDGVLNYDLNMLFFTFQVPEVLMGKGSIPEGLAKVQMEAFQRRIQSIQAEVEKVIETQIFKRVLFSNGLDVHVEFEWGQPSESEKNERIDKISNIMKIPFISFELRDALEKEVSTILNIEVKQPPKEERQKEETQPQPKVPGQKESYDIKNNLDVTLKEWIDFNYQDYLNDISEYIDEYDFNFLKAKDINEVVAGKLSVSQIKELKNVLKDNFRQGSSIRKIAKDIRENVKIKDLFKMKNGKIVTDENGKPILKQNRYNRSINIARTETARTAVGGALKNFKKNKVQKVRWVTAFSDRTCPECADMDGRIFDIDEAEGICPLHPMCRCSLVPVVEL